MRLYMSSQTTNTVVFVAILVIIVIAIVAIIVRGRKSEKPSVDSKPSPSPAKPPKPPTGDKRTEKEEGTRVVTSFASKKGKSDAEKTKTPSEAEFKQLMAWKQPAAEVKTCDCCGAEMGRLVSVCPACGHAN